MAKKKQPGQTVSELQAALAKGRVAPVYLVAGPEHFLADQAVAAIGEAVASQTGECVRSFYHGDETDLATVLDTLRTPDLFSPARLIIISPAARFVEKYDARLAAYVAAPADASHLVLVLEKTDGRKKLTKTVEKAGGLVACKRLYDRDLIPWITARAKAMGRSIDSGAASLLAEFLGPDLAMLAAELDKLAVFAGGRKKITAAAVQEVSLRDRGHEIYELTDAIGRRQPARALAVLEGLLERGGKETGILFGVARHMRRLWTVKEQIGKGVKAVDAARKVGVNFYVDQFLAQVSTFGLRELRYNCSALLRCDASLKNSVIADKRILLETAFIHLITRKKRKAARTS